MYRIFLDNKEKWIKITSKSFWSGPAFIYRQYRLRAKKKPGCRDSVKGEYDRLIEVKMTMTEGKQNIWTLTTVH